MIYYKLVALDVFAVIRPLLNTGSMGLFELYSLSFAPPDLSFVILDLHLLCCVVGIGFHVVLVAALLELIEISNATQCSV